MIKQCCKKNVLIRRNRTHWASSKKEEKERKTRYSWNKMPSKHVLERWPIILWYHLATPAWTCFVVHYIDSKCIHAKMNSWKKNFVIIFTTNESLSKHWYSAVFPSILLRNFPMINEPFRENNYTSIHNQYKKHVSDARIKCARYLSIIKQMVRIFFVCLGGFFCVVFYWYCYCYSFLFINHYYTNKAVLFTSYWLLFRLLYNAVEAMRRQNATGW